ncbi:MAG: helix-turn-helix domain-containing protein, partial [Asgard group archaeon]|nr:helix-turn-helix domain-containing protein [Asgard group archaeon]
MSKKVVSSDYLRARGLSEQEITVYSTVLGLGSATIGEISLSIKMELPEIYVQIKQLQEIGYIKQIPGKVPRYIAMEPFLKDYVQLTSEVKLGLLNIQDNFHSDVEEFNTQIKTIVPSLQHQAEREKTEKLAASMEKYDQLQKNLIKLIDKSFLQIKHFANTLTTWPSQCLEKTIPAFEKDLEQSKDQFVSAISNYADSLVIDSREIRDRLEKATIQHKIMVAERLEKLKADIDDAITKLNDDIIKQNYETTSSLGTKLDEKDIAARERAADIITNLVNNVAVLAREKEGDISSETAQMINNSLGPLFKVFDALQNEIKSVLSNVLEKQSQRAATTFRQINQEVDTSIPEVLETITDHLEMSRDESAKFIDQKITDPFKELEKMKGDIGQDIEVFKDNLMQVANKQDEIVKENIAERI